MPNGSIYNSWPATKIRAYLNETPTPPARPDPRQQPRRPPSGPGKITTARPASCFASSGNVRR
ncbi:hypothetical protein GCM10022254_54580 [Actinomadura meridiana]|uniref:Uncharacterized protein n=1 Tax=Actinomadura meridiana TaxID=559626 RepID=A0ABP8CEY3_9ACTN